MCAKRLMDRIAEKIGIKGQVKPIKSFDVIGDIAIIKIPNELLDYKQRIAEELLKELKNVRVVFRQASEVSGIYRIRKLEWLAGEKRTLTVYKEHGCRFLVDVDKVYFSPRLSTERLRIASLVKDGETIINMFAGVGPYSIIIAKKKPNVFIYSIDLNPIAVKLHVENCKLNKVDDRIKVILGDAREILKKELVGVADRVLMPLPEIALDSLDSALSGLKREGVVHVYIHVLYEKREVEALKKASQIVKRKLEKLGVTINSISTRRVREVKTRELQVCVDVSVTKKYN